jgi:hypothetical protein
MFSPLHLQLTGFHVCMSVHHEGTKGTKVGNCYSYISFNFVIFVSFVVSHFIPNFAPFAPLREIFRGETCFMLVRSGRSAHARFDV